MRRILITGKTGYIASSLIESLNGEYEVVSLGRSDIDLTNAFDVMQWFRNKYFDVVIHTAIQGGHRLSKDDMSILDTNLRMYYNILDNNNHYGKLINIGSGAELFAATTPYGLSKHIIRQSVLDKKNFYNVRAFAVFDENELPTRFIKSSILRYMKKEPIQIFQDKKMDFFYMKDFVQIIKKYIEGNTLPKEIDCTYTQSYRLSDIAEFINTLDLHTVDIDIQSEYHGVDYCGNHKHINVQVNGLFNGIQSVYEKLSCKK